MVFYLKYRPQKIAELDLPEVREGLSKLAKTGQFPHALLFTGPRGSGKTSAARIIAKAVNCTTSKGKGEPCNRCSVCKEITGASFIDLIEIDGASNRGIDDVRNLREKIKLVPSRGKFKVYIIDEVHMLTTEAFNALLKTLEEPPAHALFILCTTEAGKLPETIVSRCLRFNFRKGKPQEVEAALKKAVKGEKLKIEKGVLPLIAKNVDGSFRDGHKLLNQLSAEGKKITLKGTKELLGQIEALSPLGLIKILAAGQVKEGLLEVNRLVEAGADLKLYLQQFLETLRWILLHRLGVGDFEEPEESESLSVGDLKKLVGLFSRAAIDLKTSAIPQLPIELAIIEWVEVKDAPGGNGEVKKPVIDNPADKEPEIKKEVKVIPVAKIKEGNSKNPRVKLAKVVQVWEEVLTKVKPLNHSVGALLRACRPHQVEGDFLVLEVFYPFHKERLETERIRSIVEEVTQNVLGCPVKIKCILSKKERPKVSSQPVSTPPAEEPVDILTTAEEIFQSH